MKNGLKYVAVLMLTAILSVAGSLHAHNTNPMPWIVPSPGVVSATTITIDGSDADWPSSATSFPIADYGAVSSVIAALSATAKVLHKADGVYLFLTIADASQNNNDSIQIRFDVNHNGSSAPEVGDWGIGVRRNGQVHWGAATVDPAEWTAPPAGTAAVTPTASSWSAEVKIPTGAPTGIDLTAKIIGVYFQIYDIDQAFGDANAKYTQWPAPPAMTVDALFDTTPINWGNYEFDLATTFPDIRVTDIRNTYDGPENYRKISHMEDNTFNVTLNNPGGAVAVPVPTNARINLYLAARGIGEPWHRLDEASVIDADCAAATWPFTAIAKSNVCSGTVSLDDISAASISDVVNNTAKYTTKDNVFRVGGQSISIPVGTNHFDILDWDTTPAQDDFYKEVVVNSNTYRRQHQCMMAEAIVPGDPNPGNNTAQVNLDFICVPGAQKKKLALSLGWAGFGKYDPARGKAMHLQLVTRNTKDDRWKFDLEAKGVKQVGAQAWIAHIQGKESLAVELGVIAPPEESLGRPIKRNLKVPPQAGGDQPNASKRSGLQPVYVKVNPNTTIQIVNFSHEHHDEQFVDLDDAQKEFRPNGPAGYLPEKLLEKYGRKNLIAPNLPLGALIGSFDNFKKTFLVAEGVQVAVPKGATHLAFGINDFNGQFADNAGTGFRVKVMELARQQAFLDDAVRYASSLIVPEANAMSRLIVPEAKPIPIQDVMPTLCLQGYEETDHIRVVGDGKRRLIRYIGNVCWGLLNVYDPKFHEMQDTGDEYVAPKSWWRRLFGG